MLLTKRNRGYILLRIKVALQEQDEELVKKQHEAQKILKTGEALLADGNAKLSAALLVKTFQWPQLRN